MTRGIPLPLHLVFVFLVGGCAGHQPLDIEYDYDADASFETLKTWSWIATKGSETGSADVDRIVREELADELKRRGFTETKSGGDFLVGFVLETDRKMTERLVYNRYGYAYDSYPFDSVGTVDVQVDDYRQGTLIVDIAKSDGKQPIWRGWAEGVIREKLSDEQVRDGVKNAVRRILAKFPPPASRKKS